MKYFSEYLVAVTLAFGVLTLAAIDAHAKVVCGPNGCIGSIRTARNGLSANLANPTILRPGAAMCALDKARDVLSGRSKAARDLVG